MVKNSKCSFNDLLSKYRRVIIYFFVFLLLLSSGVKTDWILAISSAIYTISIIILFSLFIRYILIKNFLQHRKTFLYYFIGFVVSYIVIHASVIGEIGIFNYLDSINIIEFSESIAKEKIVFPFFRMTIILILTFAITTISYLQEKDKKSLLEREELTSEKLAMELLYLKSQINPHFLFNALNNMYSMVYTGDENAAESVLKLSEMLRYVTVDCQTDIISLEKEVKYIENYIDFQIMSMEKSSNITFTREIQHPDFKLVPMIFQPLVENCFKHSRLKNNSEGFIHVSIKQVDKELVFTAENSVVQSVALSKKEQSGIGVSNVKKRLGLMYGKNFDLDIENNSQFYRVVLKIKGYPFDFKK